MSITFNFKEIDILSIKFLIIFINDLLLYIIFFIWYLLFQFNVITSPNPLFAYIITLIYNIFILIYMIYKKISIDKVILYLFIIFILRILPIYYMITYYKLKIDLVSIYITIMILLIYFLILIVINNILLHNDINLLKILSHNIDIINGNQDLNNLVEIKNE